MSSETVECRVCGEVVNHFLIPHLPAHGMCVDSYLEKYPGAPTVSVDLYRKLRGRLDDSSPRPGLMSAAVRIGGVEHSVNLGVPQTACLPLPQFYRPPVGGQAGVALFHLSLALTYARAIWVHGGPGTGKDAAFHYYSAATQRPTLVVQIIPKVDLRPWLAIRGYKDGEMCWEDGPLVKAVRDGYDAGGGRRVPYLILFTDIDRAEADQLEHLRMMVDSIQGRVVSPSGMVYPVLSGTQFVATANTTGNGEGSVQHVTARAQDASLLDRFTVKLEWFPPEVPEVMQTLKDAYPDHTSDFHVLAEKVVKSLRNAARTTSTIFSMRDIFAVCDHGRMLVRKAGWDAADSSKLMMASLRIWLGGLAEDQRLSIRSVINPYFSGGLLPEEKMP